MQWRDWRTGFMIIVVAIAGGLMGAVGLSIFAAVASAALEPESFGEQQFAVGFAFTILLGLMVGSITSVTVRLSRHGRHLGAGWIAVVGGTATAALATSIAWGSAYSGEGGTAEFLYALTSPWIAPSWLGGAALVIWGRRAGRWRFNEHQETDDP
jgi:hypothetical protein